MIPGKGSRAASSTAKGRPVRGFHCTCDEGCYPTVSLELDSQYVFLVVDRLLHQRWKLKMIKFSREKKLNVHKARMTPAASPPICLPITSLIDRLFGKSIRGQIYSP